jgi:hypothetical protein
MDDQLKEFMQKSTEAVAPANVEAAATTEVAAEQEGSASKRTVVND